MAKSERIEGARLSNLTLITLPIGNSQDITLRALEALKAGEYFYAEDTRVFKNLLTLLGIDFLGKQIDSFHEHSSFKMDKIVEKIKAGTPLFLVSDAGSPMISDPAYPLLKRMREEGIEIKTIPGVTSVVTALELSGLPPMPFHFWGFIGRSKNEREAFFKEAGEIFGTHIFFESPHRIFETMDSFFTVIPEGELVLTKELTKIYESVYRVNKENREEVKKDIVDKGEFVLLFHNKEKKGGGSINDQALKTLVNDYLDGKGTPKKLAKIFAKISDREVKEIYELLNGLQSEKDHKKA